MAKAQLRILIVGQGGREHALAWKLSQSEQVDQIFVAPGNGGTGFGKKTVSVGIHAEDFDGLVTFAIKSNVNLVIPGPEQPLVDGIEAAFRQVGIAVFGPTAQAAAMEGSKTFSKLFMSRHNIPTAAYENFSDYDAAVSYVKSINHRVVIKASGLAAGKGVLIPETTEEAIKVLEAIMVKKEFGSAGEEVVIEEFMTGQELSILAFSDGYTVLALPGAQDHKRIGEGDTGLNTGGMGAYAPAPCATKEMEEEILKTIVQPTIDGMRKEGLSFVGLLFTGVMLTPTGPRCLEYNVRFGDPETETLLALLAPEMDLAEIFLACVERRLDSIKLLLKKEFAVTVVLASQGYPGDYVKGIPITIGALPKDVEVFHAGTSFKDGQVVTNGGRVLAVTATAATLELAVKLAYEGVGCVHFDGMVYRKDIGYRAFLKDAVAEPTRAFTYASAGVSIDAGNELVNQIKPIVKATKRIGSDSVIGGFGGLFDLKAAGFKDPIIVSGTDGVGTKLKVAQSFGKHDTVGIDLVAMSVNDLIVQGAEPLFFLDYFACGKLEIKTAVDVVKGVAAGCIESGCALVGGETAEMPDLYAGDDYDIAGFAVGAVERELVLPRPNIAPGDILLGLASSGVHSNGFSLVRKIVDSNSFDLTSPCPWKSTSSLGEELLTPTTIYVKQLLPSIRLGLIKGLSHITGGGFTENVPRVLPKDIGCWVDAKTYDFPPVFKWLMKHGGVAPAEMARTFNCGIGMVVVVAVEQVEEVTRRLKEDGVAAVYRIGEVQAGEGCVMRNLESWSGWWSSESGVDSRSAFILRDPINVDAIKPFLQIAKPLSQL